MVASPPTTRCHERLMTWWRSAAPTTTWTRTRLNPTIARINVHERCGLVRSVTLLRLRCASARLATAATAAWVVARSGENDR